MVTLSVPAGVGRGFEHPATTTKSAAAPARPNRVRNRRAAGKVRSSIIASSTSSICCLEIGGVLLDAGGGIAPRVMIVTFATVPAALAFTDAGAVQLPCEIVALHESVTLPVKPPTPVTVTGTDPFVPRVTVIDCALIVKSHAVPVSVTVCGLPAALSGMESVAERDPLEAAGGVNVTMIRQVPFGATLAPLVHVVPVAIAKSDAFVPEMLGAAVMFRAALPVFLTVTV
jgi:hypothetical protein